MRYEDTVLLQKWAKICWHISVERTAREPHKYADGEQHRGMLEYIREDEITKSKGYRDLRRKFLRLSPGAQRNFRKWMATQVQLVEQLKRQVEKEGGVFSYADLTFDVRTEADGKPIGDNIDPTERVVIDDPDEPRTDAPAIIEIPPRHAGTNITLEAVREGFKHAARDVSNIDPREPSNTNTEQKE